MDELPKKDFSNISNPYFRAAPITCSVCGDVVGEASGVAWLGGELGTKYFGLCSGKGKHPKPERTEHALFGGLVKEVALSYPETRTISSWREYVGPANRFLLWCAIMRYGGVTVNRHSVWWEWGTGFLGNGLVELMKKD